MLQSEMDSNIAEWVSQFPTFSEFIQRNRDTFSLFPPARNESEVSEGQWERVVSQITERNLESGTSTGEKS